MIDMYPKEASYEVQGFGESESSAGYGLDPMLSQTPYFDSWSDGENVNYQRQSSSAGMFSIGGVRHRLGLEEGAGSYFCLSKYPLCLWSQDTAYANVHFPHPFEQNPTEAFAALLHFKIGRDFAMRVEAALAENEHWNGSCEYRVYERWLHKGAHFFSDRVSNRFSGAEQLVAQGFMKAVSWDEDEGKQP